MSLYIARGCFWWEIPRDRGPGLTRSYLPRLATPLLIHNCALECGGNSLINSRASATSVGSNKIAETCVSTCNATHVGLSLIHI